jgi:hypothetical protein
MVRHLAECRECRAYSDELARVRRLVRTLPRRRVPARLQSQLEVMASHAAASRAHHANARATLRHWFSKVLFSVDNAMRPIALPFAGGICSALILFLTLMPNLGFPRDVHNDVPIALYTEASMVEVAMIEMAPFNIGNNDEIVVEVSLDEKGQITGYSIPRGAKISHDLANGISQVMLLSSFTPATLFGQPTASKLLLTFRRERGITVKG